MQRPIAWIMVFFSLSIASQAVAAVHEVEVMGVGVHDDIEIAQRLADDYAKKRAIYLLAQKWQVPDLEKKLSKLDEATLAQAIRGARTLDFRREGDILYTKTIVSVLDAPIKRALKLAEGEDVAEKEGIGILLVPVFKDGERIWVFDRSNPLRQPVRRAALTLGNQLVVVPLGDSRDLRVVDYDNILDARYDTFKPLLERYGAKEVVVALVDAPDVASNTTRVLYNRMYDGGLKPEILDIKTADKTNLAARYEEVAKVVVSMAAKQAVATSVSEQKQREAFIKQHVLFSFTTMQEYGRLDQLLRAAPGVEALEIGAIALQQVEAVFYHKGNLNPVLAYLEKKGVKLREKGAIWVLSER